MVAQKTPRTTTPAPVPAPAPEPAPAAKSARRSPAKVQPKALQSDPAVDPTTDAALLALSARHAAAPDIPIKVAVAEIASLARLAKGEKDRLAAVGIDAVQIEALRRFGLRLEALEKAWGAARTGVKLTATQRKLRDEAETLDSKLVAGGRWGCRKDEEAQKVLTLIADGGGLVDTVQDLRALVVFWAAHPTELGKTDITAKDLTRATYLADTLDAAAAVESASVEAARALDLRNRAFWGSDELAKEIREGGRYAFREEPRVAAKFTSRYRATVLRRSRDKSKAPTPLTPSPD